MKGRDRQSPDRFDSECDDGCKSWPADQDWHDSRGHLEGKQEDCTICRLKGHLSKVTRAFKMLSGYTQAVQRTTDETTLLKEACKTIVDAGGYMMAWVGYAACDAEKLVKPVAVAGTGVHYVAEIRLSWGDNPLGQGPTGIAIRTGRPAVSRDIRNCPFFSPWREAAAKFGYVSSISLPLICDDTIIGALNVYSGDPEAFDEDEIDLLSEIASVMSFGIVAIRMRTERWRAQEEVLRSWRILRVTLDGIVRAMATVTELRDPYTAGHQGRVGLLAEAIAAELGLSSHDVEGVGIAGRVHDLGKVYVPIQILSKPSLLTPVEYSLVKVHSEAGYEVLKNIEFPWPVSEAVLQHHERMDGSGYPTGLTGHDILPEARIIAGADTVEAMSNERPYRPAPGIEAALNEISEKAGKAYDPDVAAACVRLFREGRFRFP
jgi:HD-GYP domain-containing protein (c-di-GMP phosphodiesterase class II)